MNSTVICPSEDGRWIVKRREGDLLTYYTIFELELAALYVFRQLIAGAKPDTTASTTHAVLTRDAAGQGAFV